MIMFIILFFPILFAFIGIILILVQLKFNKSEKDCTAITTGTIVEVNESTSYSEDFDMPGITTTYFPICNFTVADGSQHQATPHTGSGKKINIGDTRLIRYNPENPDVAYVIDGKPMIKLAIGFFVASIFYLIFWVGAFSFIGII